MSLKLVTASVVVLAAVNLPCGAMQNAVKAPTATEVGKLAAADADGRKKVERDCKPMGKRAVPFQEETSLGGAVAVRFVSGSGNLLIEKDASGEPLTKSDVNALNRYLNRVGKNLAGQSARPTIPWTFGVMRSQDFNAVSAPGGYVFVAAGLLKQVETEAQLAGVLAHEIAHITQKHAIQAYNAMLAEKCEKAAFAKRNEVAGGILLGSLDTPDVMNQFTAKLGVPGGFIDFDSADGAKLLGPVVDGLADVLMKGYSHDDEYEADRIAIDLMVSAGYHPHEYINFLGRIPASGGLLTSHPDKSARQKKAREYVQALASSDGFGGGQDYNTYAPVKLKDELKLVKK